VVEVPVAGRSGIPSDATAAVLNVTISGPVANNELRGEVVGDRNDAGVHRRDGDRRRRRIPVAPKPPHV
jgi:hypothetical protein